MRDFALFWLLVSAAWTVLALRAFGPLGRPRGWADWLGFVVVMLLWPMILYFLFWPSRRKGGGA